VGGGGGGTRRCAEGEEGAFVREGTGPSLCCAKSGRDVGGRRVAEYEEFDECSEEDYDGELAKEEALCEGEGGLHFWGIGSHLCALGTVLRVPDLYV